MQIPLTSGAQLFRLSDFYMRQSVIGLGEADLRARVGKANSILWIAGHVTVGRRRLVNFIGAGGAVIWEREFGKGSAEAMGLTMPSLEDVLAEWDRASAELHARLPLLTEVELEAKMTYELPESNQTVLGWINYMAFHEAYHIGQISQLRKALGQGMARRTAERLAAAR